MFIKIVYIFVFKYLMMRLGKFILIFIDSNLNDKKEKNISINYFTELINQNTIGDLE